MWRAAVTRIRSENNSQQDKSFVGAVTLDGWTTKPQCFHFIERELQTCSEFDVMLHSSVILVCNDLKKCVFIRVVDTCAGCAKGSRHVDLTRAAFNELASPDEGVLTVQMRHATDPDNW
jgi:hypothetical protein